ncbi:MAG TPA: restriction endonuclease [bacterium]|nr:restriction endonuclease [bacterium]
MSGILTLSKLKSSAREYLLGMNKRRFPELFGVTDGKAVGTFVEHAFHKHLQAYYHYQAGSSASGIDFPKLEVDLKVTSIRQPQSSCPYKSASQKVYGLGYHLLVFVYDKQDDPRKKSAHLNFQHAIFVNREYTSDFQTTQGLIGILERSGNKDDIVAFLEERNLPLDEIGRDQLAERILREPPKPGCLTISNALQWRLQYGRIVSIAAKGGNEGVENLLGSRGESS